MSKKPSEIHSCLTDERIDYIGKLIARVRTESLDAVEDRDNGWSIGCRAHAWICSEIQSQAENISWLNVVDPSLRFIAQIGSVQFSFYRGTAKKPKKNICSRAQSHPELRQKMLFDDLPIPKKLVWAYAVETDLEGVITNVEFLGISESGEVVASRTVPPIFDISTKPVAINTIECEPVELPPASASLPKTRKGKVEVDPET